MIDPAAKYHIEFSNKLHLPNGTITQDDPWPVGGGGPSVVHQIGIASHVSGRTTITNPDIIDLINAYRLSNKCRGKVTATYPLLYAYYSNPNSETRLEARIVPVEPGMAPNRSSSRNPREAPVVEVELARKIWAVVASVGQVYSCRVAA